MPISDSEKRIVPLVESTYNSPNFGGKYSVAHCEPTIL